MPMNRRDFLKSLAATAAAFGIPLPDVGLAAAPIVTEADDFWHASVVGANDGLVSADAFNKPIEPATQVDFVPLDEHDTVFTSSKQLMVVLIGYATFSEPGEACFDFTVDGVRQGHEKWGHITVRAVDGMPCYLRGGCYPARELTAGTHTYGIVQRVSNGIATTNARIHVSEVW